MGGAHWEDFLKEVWLEEATQRGPEGNLASNREGKARLPSFLTTLSSPPSTDSGRRESGQKCRASDRLPGCTSQLSHLLALQSSPDHFTPPVCFLPCKIGQSSPRLCENEKS